MVLRGGGSCLRSSGRPLSSHLPGTGTSSCSSLSSRRSDLFPAGKNKISLPFNFFPVGRMYIFYPNMSPPFIYYEWTLRENEQKANTSLQLILLKTKQHPTHTHHFSPLNPAPQQRALSINHCNLFAVLAKKSTRFRPGFIVVVYSIDSDKNRKK